MGCAETARRTTIAQTVVLFPEELETILALIANVAPHANVAREAVREMTIPTVAATATAAVDVRDRGRGRKTVIETGIVGATAGEGRQAAGTTAVAQGLVQDLAHGTESHVLAVDEARTRTATGTATETGKEAVIETEIVTEILGSQTRS